MKEIETQKFIPHSDEKKRAQGLIEYVGQRKAIDVFNDIKVELYEQLASEIKESIDYIFINKEIEDKEIPKGTLVAYANECTEAYRVRVSIIENSEKYTELMSMKVWGQKDALEIQKILTIIINH